MSFDRSKNELFWEFGLASLFYTIFSYGIMPIFHLLYNLRYLQPFSLIIGGVCVWLIVRFVLFEENAADLKKNRLFFISTFIFVIIVCFNMILGIITDFMHQNSGSIPFKFSFLGLTILYYIASYRWRIVSNINRKFTDIKKKWREDRSKNFAKRQLLGLSLVVWLQFSILYLVIPVPVYVNTRDNTDPIDQSFGFWTYGTPLDDDRVGKKTYIDNDTLQILGDNSVYLVYRMRADKLNNDLIHSLTRCKDRGVRIHVAVTPDGNWNNFVNTWTFSEMRSNVAQILKFLNDTDFMGNTVTKLVYDMEVLPWAFFPTYGCNQTIISEVGNYYNVQQQFQDFNDEIRENYSIPIEICSDLFQGFDKLDGDDDISSLWGLLYDTHPSTTWSYMIYRRDNLGPNYVIDNCRYLNNGDTIILNVWKYDGYFCWEDLDCAIDEARSVITYNRNGKHFSMEVWALYYFLKSYGQEGLVSFIGNLTSDASTWEPLTIENKWPYSTYSDAIFFGVSWLDYFAPFFRLIFGVL